MKNIIAKIELTLAVVSLMTEKASDRSTVDEMQHSGGAGITFVERWPLLKSNDLAPVWLWRLMWIPRHERGPSWQRSRPVRIGYGAVQGGQEAAQRAGRKKARQLAKERRANG